MIKYKSSIWTIGIVNIVCCRPWLADRGPIGNWWAVRTLSAATSMQANDASWTFVTLDLM